MRHFKLPLIVTAIAFVLVLVTGITGAIWISESSGSNREKETRAQMLGSGSAMLLGIIVAPFWLLAASKVGKERRAAKQAAAQRTRRPEQSITASLPPRKR